jgi:hypothetical protein
MTLPRQCIVCREYAVPGRSRCKAHGGKAWARQPKARQAAYADPTYLRNRRLTIAREPAWPLGAAGVHAQVHDGRPRGPGQPGRFERSVQSGR